VLMNERRDALCGAAELVLACEKAAKETGAADSVATTGICEVFPGAVNSVPSRTLLRLDVRDIDAARRDRMTEQIRTAVDEVRQRRNLKATLTVLNADPPASCALEVVEAIETAAAKCGCSSQRMVSRAYHDSLFMARLTPTGMIFIPCRNGVSHRPDEYSSPEHLVQGVQVLAETLQQLAS